ncbi:hypothetical protein [Sorangium sp. So ce388]|uniref:hypothetical protein n=1 Tax=Sorangium sp. So ce388 TaxID=3133309 RepID=UPI003F5C8D21
MLSAVSALTSPPCSAPAAPSFAQRALDDLRGAGWSFATSRSARPVGSLRWLPQALPSGRVRVEVVETPWGTVRDVVETAAMQLRVRGYRVLACPGLGRLTICRGRQGDAAATSPAVLVAPAAQEAA